MPVTRSRSSRLMVIGSLWLASAAGSWYVGTRTGPRVKVGGETGERPAQEAIGGLGGTVGPKGGSESGRPGGGGGGGVAMRGRLSADVYRERLSKLRAMPPGRVRNDEITGLFTGWASADPAGALTGVEEVPEPEFRSGLRESVLRRWAAEDPEKAWAHVLAEADTRSGKGNPETVLDGIGRGDVRAALDFFTSHSEALAKYPDRAAVALDDLYERGNHDTLTAWAAALPPGNLRDMAVGRITDRWARTDPGAAKAWMEGSGLSGEALQSARAELADSWAGVEPEAALAWVESLSAEKEASSLYSQVFTKWIRLDRDSAASWLAARPSGPALDRPIEQYVGEVMDENPADTMPWAESINDTRRRGVVMARVAAAWFRKDRAGCEAYLREVNLPEEEKRRLWRSAEDSAGQGQ